MRALVTGGAGLIGSHLTELLIARGDEVVVLDDLSTGREENLGAVRGSSRLTLRRGDVRDEDLVRDAARGCGQVFHLAAAVGVSMILDRPLHTIETNVRGAEVVLRAAAGVGAATLVASSSEVYGRSAKLPYSEDDDLVLGPRARWGYACSKLIDEFIALAWAQEHGARVVVARVFNTVGPRQLGTYGMVLPRMVARARRGEAIEVYGDGAQTRCFAYAGDTARTFAALLDHPEAWGRVFNVGNDAEVSIRALAERVRDRFAPSVEIRHVPYERAYGQGFEELPRRVPDLRRVRALLGPSAYLDLDGILERFARG